MRPNVLFITVDDLNYDSLDFWRQDGQIITPHINKLRQESCYFEHAHVNVGVCQPARQCMMTGKLPHNNGSHGFEPISETTTTLQEVLHNHGYVNGIIGKMKHLAPRHKYCWDEWLDVFCEEYLWGRHGESYYEFCKGFFDNRKRDGKPFFLMANSHDPHRPYAGSQCEKEKYGYNIPVKKMYKPEEIKVPGFLPDLPEVREEIAQYYTSVHRGDETVGVILKALEEAGLEENTIVFFLSDNGIACPFAKTNCYLNSTKTPLLIKWPEMIKPNSLDEEHMVSTVDFMPTILDIMDIDTDIQYDGRSFLKVLEGGIDATFNHVHTLFNKTNARKTYEMRCVQTKDYGYIYNPWSDGEVAFENESMSGLTFNAMKEAAERDKDIAHRVDLFLYRQKEEFYEYCKDPDGLNDLSQEENYAKEMNELRHLLLESMTNSNDPLLQLYKQDLGGDIDATRYSNISK